MWANEAKEVIKTDSLERRAKKKGGGAVNSLLCRLLSRMNEAECLGRNQGQLARCSLGYSEDIYCLSPTLTASSFLDIFCPPHPTLSPLCMSHPSPDRRQLWHQGCPDFCLPRRGFIDSHQVAWHALTLGNNSHVTLAAANAPQGPHSVLFFVCLFAFFSPSLV